MTFSIIFFISDARNYLRKMREEQIRDGEYVVRLWEDYLIDNSHKLGDECEDFSDRLTVV